jgi:hypothetical protein
MRTKISIPSLAILIALLVALWMPATASALGEGPMPVQPTAFCGSVTINDAPAEVGTIVKGVIVDAVGDPGYGIFVVTTTGQYGKEGPNPQHLIISTDSSLDVGKDIEFYIKLPDWSAAHKADQTGTFDSVPHRLDITIRGDFEAPVVISKKPEAGATGISPTVVIEATFNQDVVPADLSIATITGGATGVSATLNGRTLTIAHDALVKSKTYTVIIPSGAVKDASGNDNIASTWSFTTKAGSSNNNTGGGGGGSAAPSGRTISAEVFGIKADLLLSSTGTVQEFFRVTSADGKMGLTIPEGTVAREAGGSQITSLTGGVASDTPQAPIGTSLVGPAVDFGPDGATFSPAIGYTYQYGEAEIPAGVTAADLMAAYYDAQASKWVDIKSIQVDSADSIITVHMPHFTTMAILATRPAAFTATLKDIAPKEAGPGNEVTVTYSIANTGGKNGSYTSTLLLNGSQKYEKSVSIAAGGSAEVSFTLAGLPAGRYTVSVGGVEGSFTLIEPSPTTTIATTTPPGNSAEITPSKLAAAGPPVAESTPSPIPPLVDPTLNLPLIIGIIAAVVIIALSVTLVLRRKTAS